MNRIELLKEIENALNYRQCRSEEAEEIKQAFKELKQDLDQLEKLEKENKELKETNNIVFFKNNSNDIRIKNIINENAKLKQALDKACERLEYYIDNCPCGEELIEDLDCDECDNNCKECWKKYFMKEVLDND